MTRHPLRSRAFLAALVTAVLAALVLVGLLDPEEASKIETVAGLFLTAFVTGGLVVVAGEPKVTPVDDPRTDAGTPLVPAPTVATSRPEDGVVRIEARRAPEVADEDRPL